MKATLQFDLDERFEREAHLRAVKSLDLALAILDMQQWLRSEIKYKDREELEEVHTTLHDILESRGLDIDELIS